MSDFDDVLERLLVDPVFQARLAADPNAALAGYRLDPGERQLLNAQLSGADGTDRTVEMRTSKSGIIGMVGPVLSAMGLEAEVGHPPLETIGNAPGHPPLETIGDAPIHGPLESMGSAPSGHVVTSMGQAPEPVESMGQAGGHASMGQAPSIVTVGHYGVDPLSITTVDGIAAAHGISEAQLLSLNPEITNPNLIFPGQQIRVA
jgi:hypothetical protein